MYIEKDNFDYIIFPAFDEHSDQCALNGPK